MKKKRGSLSTETGEVHLVSEEDVATDDPNSLADAYRLCARGGVPCYEHLRFDFGDGHIVTFERLLVPFSRGGPRVTHIAGLVVYSGRTRDDDPAAENALS